MRLQLAKGQITAEDDQAGGAECTRQRYEKWRIAVCSRSMSQYKAISTWASRAMEEAANRHIFR
jgi:hypothetical protein